MDPPTLFPQNETKNKIFSTPIFILFQSPMLQYFRGYFQKIVD